ncbi:MAG: SAM-dependent methyltransferase [Reichenbachiella sp.]
MDSLQDFIDQIEYSLKSDEFVKITLSKPRKKDTLQNIYIRPIDLKGEQQLSFTFHYKTNDQVKNYAINDGIKELEHLLTNSFQNALLCSTTQDLNLLTSKKGKITLIKKQSTHTTAEKSHDRQKIKRSNSQSEYLRHLGITDEEHAVIPKMADKFKQINKYLEIMESLIESADLPKNAKIVDMGSGKGYLTFALYDYLKNKGFDLTVTGIELRADLVAYCNEVATKCGFDQLQFVQQPIQEYENDDIDILIALHACDTATDDAIAKGLHAKAKIIVCAPCCHKQVRQQLKGKTTENPILKYGIFKERQYEMVTDTIRALIMEREGYESKVFEFISNEHTRKNVMLVGVNTGKGKTEEALNEKIEEIKKSFDLDFHYLENAL